MMNLAGNCSEMSLLAGGNLEAVEDHGVHDLLVIVLRQYDTGAPVHLPEIFEDRQLVRAVAGDAADARIDCERHLDELVQGRRIAGGAERADIFLLDHRLQRGVGVEDAAAAGAEHVP